MHSSQLQARSGKFWMTSHPVAIDDSGVVPLMSHWGGEVVSMWQRNQELLQLLAGMGRPRVLEIVVPLSLTTRSYNAVGAVVATFSRTLGVFPETCTFDFYAATALPGESILRVHTEGEDTFTAIARGYPETFAVFDRWKELGLPD